MLNGSSSRTATNIGECQLSVAHYILRAPLVKLVGLLIEIPFVCLCFFFVIFVCVCVCVCVCEYRMSHEQHKLEVERMNQAVRIWLTVSVGHSLLEKWNAKLEVRVQMYPEYAHGVAACTGHLLALTCVFVRIL